MEYNKVNEIKSDKNVIRSTIGEIDEEDYSVQSKSLTNEQEFLQKKNFEQKKSSIPFPTESVYKKSDFEILGLLGRGAYAKVVKAKLIKNNAIHAIKIIDKSFIEKVNIIYVAGK